MEPSVQHILSIAAAEANPLKLVLGTEGSETFSLGPEARTLRELPAICETQQAVDGLPAHSELLSNRQRNSRTDASAIRSEREAAVETSSYVVEEVQNRHAAGDEDRVSEAALQRASAALQPHDGRFLSADDKKLDFLCAGQRDSGCTGLSVDMEQCEAHEQSCMLPPAASLPANAAHDKSLDDEDLEDDVDVNIEHGYDHGAGTDALPPRLGRLRRFCEPAAGEPAGAPPSSHSLTAVCTAEEPGKPLMNKQVPATPSVSDECLDDCDKGSLSIAAEGHHDRGVSRQSEAAKGEKSESAEYWDEDDEYFEAITHAKGAACFTNSANTFAAYKYSRMAGGWEGKLAVCTITTRPKAAFVDPVFPHKRQQPTNKTQHTVPLIVAQRKRKRQNLPRSHMRSLQQWRPVHKTTEVNKMMAAMKSRAYSRVSMMSSGC
eukprot:366028-Chlamydomonas_euryale.AAC.17